MRRGETFVTLTCPAAGAPTETRRGWSSTRTESVARPIKKTSDITSSSRHAAASSIASRQPSCQPITHAATMIASTAQPNGVTTRRTTRAARDVRSTTPAAGPSGRVSVEASVDQVSVRRGTV
jgi:hypothetical protein